MDILQTSLNIKTIRVFSPSSRSLFRMESRLGMVLAP